MSLVNQCYHRRCWTISTIIIVVVVGQSGLIGCRPNLSSSSPLSVCRCNSENFLKPNLIRVTFRRLLTTHRPTLWPAFLSRGRGHRLVLRVRARRSPLLLLHWSPFQRTSTSSFQLINQNKILIPENKKITDHNSDDYRTYSKILPKTRDGWSCHPVDSSRLPLR